MLPVSAGYNPFTISRSASVSLQLALEADAVAGAEISAEYINTDVSDAAGILSAGDSFGGVMGTFERGFLSCDRNYKLFQDGEKTGLWSAAASGETGYFDAAPWFEITFSEPFTGIGFTINFDADAGQFARQMVIEIESGGEVETITQENAEVSAAIVYPFENVDRIRVEFTATSAPLRLIRVASVVFGYTENYTAARVLSFDYSAGELELTGESWAAGKMSAEVRDGDRGYKLSDPDLLQYIVPGLKLSAAITVNGEKIALPSMRLSALEPSGKDGVIKLEAYDAVYDMAEFDVYFHNDTEDNITNTMDGWLPEIFDGTGYTFRNDSSAGSTPFYPLRHVGKVLREWCRLIAQATKTRVKIDGETVVFYDDEMATAAAVRVLTKSEYISSGLSMPIDRINALRMEAGRSDAINWPVFTKIYAERVPGEKIKMKTITNPVVYNYDDSTGDGHPGNLADVGAWILENIERRKTHKIEYRGDPALEVGDIVTADGVRCIVTGHELHFDGHLSGDLVVVEV